MKHPSRTISGIALLVIALTIASATSSAAQGSACSLEPLTLPLWDATPPAIVAATPAVGEPAPGFTDDEIAAAVEGLIACINTGEPRLAYAVFTDRYLATVYADPAQAYLPEFEQMLDRNTIEATGQFTLESVSDIVRLDDGRVSVSVALSNGLTTFSDTLVLAWQGDAWLIDDVTELDPPLP